MNKDLPALREPIMKEFDGLWENYMKELAWTIELHAGPLQDDFNSLLPSLHTIQDIAANSVISLLDGLSAKGATACFEAVDIVKSKMKKTYSKALALSE